MNCKRAKSLIALWVGHDLEDGIVDSVRRHVGECSTCRQHFYEVRASIQALHSAESEPAEIPSRTVWPEVAVQISFREESFARSRFNGWVPASAVAAACFLLLVVAMQPPAQNQPLEPFISVRPPINIGPPQYGPTGPDLLMRASLNARGVNPQLYFGTDRADWNDVLRDSSYRQLSLPPLPR